MDTNAPVDLDLRGLKCPLPVLRTRRALRRLPAGATLIVACTDPLAGIDIPHCLREDGHQLAHQTFRDGVATFHVVKGTTDEGLGASSA